MKAGYDIIRGIPTKNSKFLIVSNNDLLNQISHNFYKIESIARKRIDYEIGMWKLKQS